MGVKNIKKWYNNLNIILKITFIIFNYTTIDIVNKFWNSNPYNVPFSNHFCHFFKDSSLSFFNMSLFIKF